jgi:ribosomal protein S18 acetylase RimI-like enzyme
VIRITLKQKPLLEAANFSLDHHYLLLQVLSRNVGGLPNFELSVIRDSRPEKEVGFMHFGPHSKFKDIWHVMNVSADPGFGPVLYEAAMELAQIAGARGLAPDPSSITEAARNVWRKYANRSDIAKEPLPAAFKVLPDEDNPRTPELFQVFSKTQPQYLNQLLSKNRLRDRGSALKNFFKLTTDRNLSESLTIRIKSQQLEEDLSQLKFFEGSDDDLLDAEISPDPFALAKSVGIGISRASEFTAGFVDSQTLIAALFTEIDDDVMMFDIVVDSKYRGQGIAKKFVEYVIRLFRSYESEGLAESLAGNVVNPVMIPLLKHYGFKVVQELPGPRTIMMLQAQI